MACRIYPFIALVLLLLAGCGSSGGSSDTSTDSTDGSILADPAVDATQVPYAPSGLTATVAGDTQINLVWLDNSSGDYAETAFVLQQKVGVGGTYADLATLTANTTSYSDTGLTPGQTYYYKIRAYNSIGSSAFSAEDAGTTTQTTVTPTGPTDVWAKTYGGPDGSKAAAIVTTSDGGYALAGFLDQHSTTAVDNDAWVIKLNASGGIQWQKSYGGLDSDTAADMKETADGGFILVGTSGSFNLSSSAGDVWVLRLASDGSIVWQKRFGTTPAEKGLTVIQTDDDGDGVRNDGFLVAGYQDNSTDMGWLIKLDSSGVIEWQKLVGNFNAALQAVEQTPDGGYIVVGTRWSAISGGEQELWVLRLDGAGNITWQKRIPGVDTSWAYDVALVDGNADGLKDDGYIIAGYADVDATTDFHYEAWVLKLATDGSIEWQNTYGDGVIGSGIETLYAVEQMADGSFALAGTTSGFGASSNDYWLLNLDASGGVILAKRFGGLGGDTAYAMQPTADGGSILAGSTSSFTPRTDIWVVKLDSTASLTFSPFLNGSIQDTTVVVTATASVPADTSDSADTIGITAFEDTTAVAADSTAVVATQSE